MRDRRLCRGGCAPLSGGKQLCHVLSGSGFWRTLARAHSTTTGSVFTILFLYLLLLPHHVIPRSRPCGAIRIPAATPYAGVRWSGVPLENVHLPAGRVQARGRVVLCYCRVPLDLPAWQDVQHEPSQVNVSGYLGMGLCLTISFAPYQSLLNSNFTATRPLVASGPSQHLSYSSGRRNALALQGTLILQPYHDVAGILTTLVKSVIEPTYDSSEGMIWHLTLGRGDAGLQGEGLGVWGIVNKSNLRFVKQQRWDLVSVDACPSERC